MPLKKSQTAKTLYPKRFIKELSSGLPDTLLPSIESVQKNSSETEISLNKEKLIPIQINAIIDMKFVFGEQYAKVSFKDQSLEPQWEPVKNIVGVEGLILKFQQKKDEEEREKRMKELKDSKDKTVSMQQERSISRSFISVQSPQSIVNWDYISKFKSVKFAQELVNTKIFSNNDDFLRAPTSLEETRIENANKSSPIKIKAVTKPILKSALRKPNKQQTETKISENIFLQWNGILLKGKTREFVAKVIIKALKEGPNHKVILDKLGSNNIICMDNTVPLSYALYLIGKDREQDDAFIMECECGNLKEEQDYMMVHKLVTFIQLENGYNGLHFFVLADYRWIYKNLQFDQKPLLLMAKSIKIEQKYLLVQQPFVQILGNKTTDVNYYKAKTELLVGDYNDIITKLCEQKPNFTLYASPKFGETDSIITVMKVLGATYFPNYDCENMDLVLVHVLMLDQINFMPNLIKLRHQEQCKFLVYGWDFKRQTPIKFEEYFVSGGILSVTVRVLLEEKNGFQRILDVIEYQKEKGANWKILMDPEIKLNNYNFDALINPDLSSFKGEYIHEMDYFNIFLWRKLKRQNDNNISRLYYALLFSYSFKAEVDINKQPRHCILIAHIEEMPFCPKVPGIDVVTLKKFEDIFGFDDSMEWEWA
ncbi:hypothetical protein C1645_822211 [Glomus cerebriforme]|uniref:Uncharacterized protein n=1 Tax=Glomus cerebriforme TaxID=658196 RepID=A0A397T1U2_9GLOM|nr:hypothetical protein C1645_822211 [Glomus cerebriforme]